MWFRRIAVALALLCAAAASQEPEFAQQYRQRLGGAIDALQRVLADFDRDAAAQGLDRKGGIARLQTNSDPLAQGGGVEIERIEARKTRLARQLREMNEAGPLGQTIALVSNLDPALASRALHNFRPALPLTAEGFSAGLIGFLLGLGVVHGAAWPVRRRLRLARERRLAA
ncbi:MAG TPA: DUF2937 family protein [Beijerinckiaceae bacterium]|nr:DUF2937 family protein [Beijerinckiaceae bacterium]HVB89979.1 DUF2937 family protein [Beijerinckiaceae bacterium]